MSLQEDISKMSKINEKSKATALIRRSDKWRRKIAAAVLAGKEPCRQSWYQEFEEWAVTKEAHAYVMQEYLSLAARFREHHRLGEQVADLQDKQIRALEDRVFAKELNRKGKR